MLNNQKPAAKRLASLFAASMNCASWPPLMGWTFWVTYWMSPSPSPVTQSEGNTHLIKVKKLHNRAKNHR